MSNVADQVAAQIEEYRTKIGPSSQAQVVGRCGVFSPWRGTPGELDIDWEALKAMPDKRPTLDGETVGDMLLSMRQEGVGSTLAEVYDNAAQGLVHVE